MTEAEPSRRSLVVGFDLDMTLIDPRRTVRIALSTLAEETGVAFDVERLVQNLGPPIEEALSPWFSGAALDDASWRYRDLHGAILADHIEPMPGAVDAVRAVSELGGRTVVVTAKYEPHARTSLKAVGIEANAVVGWRYGAEKGETLLEYGAQVYVGDHPADILAARVGGTVSVAVATGGTSASALEEAGADVVLPTLLEFPSWLQEWARQTRPTRTSP